MAPNAGKASCLFRPSLQARKLPSCLPPVQAHHSSSMKTFYFAYGSNMNQEQMVNRCPGSELGPLARLTGWRYFINGRGYAGVEESPTDQVLGCLWSLNDEHVASLDRYEGVEGNYYSKETLEVEQLKDATKVSALVYLSVDREYGIPSPRYQGVVVSGGREIGLPSDYLAMLESWENGCPDHA
jgi:gamma-glutamylcyclotransferase (GGCT)/AIG2-like uncharacterized protein YtfP